ncbi:hypothetical protein [Nonlabens sp. Asnod3-A02]|uniref:hypothetical protein n=1 Tax=Nonlabens sp. Asnod3-A02 TaxID=3160579 RepID=UPI00386B1A0B
MKLIFRIILCIVLFIGCSTSKINKLGKCNENLSFKKEFDKNIEQVEKYVKGNGNRLEFDKSLIFISKYVKVSNDKMLNYNNSYTTIEDFTNDKKAWLEWYQKNKCDNLQVK